MGSTQESCFALLRQLQVMFQLKHALSDWSDEDVLSIADRIGARSSDVRTQLCSPELAR